MKNKRNQPIEEETVTIETTLSSKTKSPAKKQNNERRAQVIKEETMLIEQEDVIEEDSIEIPISPKYCSKLFWIFVIFSISWLFYSTLISVIEAWQKNYWFGLPLAIMSLVFIAVLLLLIKRERNAFKRVDKNTKQRAQIKVHIDNDSVAGIHNILKPRLSRIKKVYPKEIAQFEAARTDRHSANDYISLLENILLSRLDKDANNAIKKASLSIAALVAISPHPALDAVLVLMRANMLIRKISQIYGLEPTGLSSLYLLKHSVISALAAAGIEEISTLLAEEISMGLTEKAAKFIAEGAVSSARLYRLGHLTKRITRPITAK